MFTGTISLTSYAKNYPVYEIDFEKGVATKWRGMSPTLSWEDYTGNSTVTGNTRIWRYRLDSTSGSESYLACSKISLGSNSLSATISSTGTVEDITSNENAFAWFYIGDNKNLFFFNGKYYDTRPKKVQSSIWVQWGANDNYKKGTKYTLNTNTGTFTTSVGGLNFSDFEFANTSLTINDYVSLTGLVTAEGGSASIDLYYWNGKFYTSAPSVKSQSLEGEYQLVGPGESQYYGQKRFYTENGIRSSTPMAKKSGSNPAWYYAGYGDYWVATAGGADSHGPIVYHDNKSGLPINKIPGDGWYSSGIISGSDGSYMNIGSGEVYNIKPTISYYFSAPEILANTTYYYTSGDYTNKIVISDGKYLKHEHKSIGYKYEAQGNPLDGEFITNKDEYASIYKYIFSKGSFSKIQVQKETVDKSDHLFSTPSSDTYTNFYMWTKTADISTSSTGSPSGTRTLLFRNKNDGKVELYFNSSGRLIKITSMGATDYTDFLMFRCRSKWDESTKWNDDFGLVFINGYLLKTNTTLSN